MSTLANASEAHSTFRIDRKLKATPARVYAAWSQAEAKRRWFSCHDDGTKFDYTLDFRLDGGESSRVRDGDGVLHGMRAWFLDIVPERRIVYAYELLMDERRISVSLVTVAFVPDHGGTLMSFTEQVVFLDGYQDGGERREGTEEGLKRLAIWLDGEG